ncbi:MAG: DUF3656 domain-containing protein [bacterium]
MKKELLCPAGSMEAFYAAVDNGADAVYISGKSFGARSFAANFSNEEIVEVIKHAHLLGVKIYVTVNTIIDNDDFSSVIDFIRFLHQENVDAIILQDLGLASVIAKIFPNLELHASTQMHNLDKYSFEFLKNLGFSRVVVARELSVGEINAIDTDLDIEAFIHGSLCVSYSGQCLFSSMAMNRSGNKGACSQLCRMPYNLAINGENICKSGKYLLSPKDLATFKNFSAIMESNIYSLKIEGRMKSPQYVAVVTRMYRKLIDSYYDQSEVSIESEVNALEYLFNRGLTGGNILDDTDIINTKRGNHKGVYIGDVISCDEKIITIKLNKPLKLKDGIKFENTDKGLTLYNLYINSEQVKFAEEGDIVTIPNNISLNECDKVLKTFDDALNTDLLVFPKRKVPVTIFVKAKVGLPLEVSMNDGINSVSINSNEVEVASKKVVTEEDISSKLLKLGTSIYTCSDVSYEIDDSIFIPISQLNEIRRNLVLMLDEKRLSRKNNFIEQEFSNIYKDKSSSGLSVYVNNSRHFEILKNYDITNFYTNSEELINKYPDSKFIFEPLLNSKDVSYDQLLINSTSDLMKYSDRNLILNYTFNISNDETIKYLSKVGKITLSAELDIHSIKKLSRDLVSNVELLIYGKVRVMTMKHCVLFATKKCQECNYNGKYKQLLDSFDREYLLHCKNGINYIYNHKPILKIRDLEIYKRLGIKNFRIDFLDESDYEVRKIMNEYFSDK